mgnify:CR=1 FL=1
MSSITASIDSRSDARSAPGAGKTTTDFSLTAWIRRYMMNITKLAALLLVAALVTCIAGDRQNREDYISPGAVAEGPGNTLYVAEKGREQLAVYDREKGEVRRHIPVPGRPTGLAIAPGGTPLLVTLDGPNGRLLSLAPGTGEVRRSIATGHTPTDPVLGQADKTAYVCNRFDDSVSIVDLSEGTERTTISVPREPIAAALSPEGQYLFVANHLPADPADAEYVSAVVSVIDTRERHLVKNIRLPDGATDLRDICISPDGKHAYVAHLLARYQLPTTQLERGWMNTNALTVIDVNERERLNTVLLDDVDRGAANPWGVACDDDGEYVCVTHAGTNELSVIDRAALHRQLQAAEDGQKVTAFTDSAEDVRNDLSFLADIRRRVELTGVGPRTLVLADGTAYVAEYFSGTLGIVTLDDEQARARSADLGPTKEISTARRGEKLFHDATICYQQWQSCASCHPGGRTDGLNWDLLNDGMGNPKNTKSLLLSHETPPAMVTGVRASAEVAVRAGLKYIEMADRPEKDARAIDAYLESLEPVPSPHLVDGELSETARRGKEVFQKAGCRRCHSGPHFTDMKQYDVGTGSGRHAGTRFDVPTLVEAWRTAPYLYDGSAATMREVLVEHNRDDEHGRTSDLTEEELDALCEYLLSL